MEKIEILLADSSTFTRIILANALETLGFEVVAIAKMVERPWTSLLSLSLILP